ncbi:MAG: hypothetical protein WD333_05355 [Dehalococcoidia bacterium]
MNHEHTTTSIDPEDLHFSRQRNIFKNPAGFIQYRFEIGLWQRQAAILNALRFHRRVAVRSCNGSGKTLTAAAGVLWWLCSFRHSIAITTAPTNHQVEDLLWREIRKLYSRNPAVVGGKLTRTQIDIGPDHYAKGLSTDQPERFQGFHHSNILFIVDEASGVREDIFEAIEGCMTLRDSQGVSLTEPTGEPRRVSEAEGKYKYTRLLLIGNPTSRIGTFYDAFHARRNLWHPVHISAFDTPNFQAQLQPQRPDGSEPTDQTNGPSNADPYNITGLITPEWVREAEQNWGPNSSRFQVRVLGEFPSQDTDTLISLNVIELAANISSSRDVSDIASGDDEKNDENSRQSTGPPGITEDSSAASTPVEIGVDVARYGEDQTVICTRKGRTVVEIGSFGRQDTMATVGRVIKAIRTHSPEVVRIDEIGIGAGVIDRLKEQGFNRVVGVNDGRRAHKPDQYANLRAEMYDGLRSLFETEQITIPNDSDLISQLASVRYSYNSTGQLLIESKESLRRAGLPSPDKADALVLAFAKHNRPRYRIWT